MAGKAVAALRYLCFTHDTGPADCVRPACGLGRPEVCGTKWGERGVGFFRKSQCGPTVAKMAMTALLLRPSLDTETLRMTAAVCREYLGRFGALSPRSGVYIDTQMEENGWTSVGLAASLLFLGGDPKARQWEESAKRWMLCTATAPEDYHSGATVEGKTVPDICGPTFTTLPDYLAENHGRVHPSYASAAVSFTGHIAVLYRLWGKNEPSHAYWNRRAIYDPFLDSSLRTAAGHSHTYWNRRAIYDRLKLLSDENGYLLAPQGMDWPYLSASSTLLHAAASLLLKDPDASHLEDCLLASIETQIERNDGRLLEPDEARCSDWQDPLAVRESCLAGLVLPYLLHRLCGKRTSLPTSGRAFWKKTRGVRVFPHSGFALNRHETGLTSFSWRNNVMALPWLRDGVRTVAPADGTFLGRVSIAGRACTRKLVSVNVYHETDGFAAVLINDIFEGTARQEVLFASLPDGTTVCDEAFTALQDCVCTGSAQGMLCITNRAFSGPQGGPSRRTLFFAGGQRSFPGYIGSRPEEDVVFPLTRAGWLNLDDRFGMVFEGTGKAVYVNRHYFPCFWGIVDDLFLNRREGRRSVRAGGIISRLTCVLTPEEHHETTAGTRLIHARAGRAGVLILAGDHAVSGNFSHETRSLPFSLSGRTEFPVLPGACRMRTDRAVYTLRIPARQGLFLRTLGRLSVEKGEVSVLATQDGSMAISASGTGSCSSHLRTAKGTRTVRIEKGKTLRCGI